MTTVHERVYQRLIEVMRGDELPAGLLEIYDRKRMASFVDAELPAMRVLPGLDQTVDRVSDYENVNDFTVSIQIFVTAEQAGMIPVVQAEAHRRLWGDPTLGGLIVRPFNVDIDERREESDRVRIQQTIRYRLRYRVAADDVTVVP